MDEQLYKQLEEDLKEHFNQKTKSERTLDKIDVIISIIIPVLIFFMISTFLSSEKNSKNFFPKELVQQNIKKAIDNNADIIILENILKSSEKTKKIEGELYPELVSLEYVLKDIQIQNYLSDNFDESLEKKISKYITNKNIPLGELPNNQKEYFLNIRNKLDDDSYLKIENDIKKIAEELSNKNSLIEIYLDNSDISFKLTIFSVILGLIALIPLLKICFNYIMSKIKKAD